MTRPEIQAPPDLYYNSSEASKYSRGSRIIDIQTKLSERAIELLLLPERPCLVLDIGCGTGISGSVLEDYGHTWIGVDISINMLDMLEVYEDESESTGDAILADIGEILRFRPGVFDGAISISVIQWLCNADKKSHEPYKRLLVFFKWLFNALNRGSRAIFQFYPESPSQIEMITSAALKSGFGGGLVVDFPNSSKAKKYFLCLWAGFHSSVPQNLPQGLTDEQNDISESASNIGRSNNKSRNKRSGNKNRHVIKSKSWILEKKNVQRQRGFKVRPDSKYTGRKRKSGF
ncbi:HUSSY-3 like methyltransferase [Cryptosporidium ryanae]|uniref:HUSSY-3 like methyltransferase n=1 Tax=Cryptosporidium ryanae TaxID=515981 RepID=UPI00351A5BB9|nr:HUSSY-3 like methyltransferase [Cryptosporidium ryanae]